MGENQDYFFSLEGRILYIPVPQTEHFPFNAGRPFFIVTRSTSTISLFALHFTQYAISANGITSFRSTFLNPKTAPNYKIVM